MKDNCQLIVFSNKAYNAIIRESFDKDPVETGGILLGHILDNGVWIVMEVLPPGKNSIFQYAYFEYDQAFVNYLAQSVANQYKRPLDLLGLWHRHPGSMDVFSSTDDDTNTTYAKQNPAGVISGLVNIDPKFRLTMYHMDTPTHQLIGRPNYNVVDVEVGDDIIPKEYFELRYFDGVESDLHPMVSSKERERQVHREVHDEQRDIVGDSQNRSSGINTEGLDIQEIINRKLPPSDEYQDVTSKLVNDFFPFLERTKKKWKYALIAVITLIACVCSFKSCNNVIEYVKGMFVKEKSDDIGEETPSLSIEEILFTTKGESQTISITYDNSSIYWESSNTDVAIVDNGKVTAVANGNSVIMATIEDGLVGCYKVKVKIDTEEDDNLTLQEEVKVEQSALGDYALIDTAQTFQHGKTGSINVGTSFVIPIKKTGSPVVTFSSSNPEIATIGDNGTITARQKGETEICILSNGVVTDKYTLTINN